MKLTCCCCDVQLELYFLEVLWFDLVLQVVVNTIISDHVDLMEEKETLARKESPIRREIFFFINMGASMTSMTPREN